MSIIEIREWIGFIAECLICYYVAREFYYDKNKDEAKKQKRTRTTKKTTTSPTGEVVTEENTESVESKSSENV